MITKEQIARINELAHKSKAEGLTEAEKDEQAKLRRIYIDSFKESLVGQLENTYIVDEKGNKRKVKRKDECEN
jgi:5-formyltetrahydrofolate cyclo-ligase